MKKFNFLLCIILLAFGSEVLAQQQNKDGVAPFWTGPAATVTVMPSIASRSVLLPSEEKEGQVQDGRASKYVIVPGKGSSDADALAQNKHKTAGTIPGKTPSLVFETAQTNSSPTDPAGAVGPNHYFAVFNTGFRIFQKDGTPLTGQLGVQNIFPNPGCCDLTVSYDNLADRWIVSFLNGAGEGIQVAMSNGPDPVTSEWTVFNFDQVSDYNKLSVWRDGYYITENTGGSNKLWVLERIFDPQGNPDPNAQMAGFELPGIVTSGFHSPQAMNITDDNHPDTGGCPIVYMQDDAWNGVAEDHIKLWIASMDWDNVDNSSVSAPEEIINTPFIGVFDNGSFANLRQPNGGADIDAIQAAVMNQGQFRKFDTHNSMIFNWVVDTDETAGELAGIRWVEMRQTSDNGAWSLFQEGTYTAPDGKHAWNGSMAMDNEGNIGLGYTGMAGPTTPTDGTNILEVSSYYTGRFSDDASGVMTVAEELIAGGKGNIPNVRYSDYSKIDVDPFNNKEFWFVNEYIGDAGGRANIVGVFQIAPVSQNDVGVTLIETPATGVLTATEEVSVMIFNFGENEATGFDITYQIDGGALVTETFSGTIASGTFEAFTFQTTADLSIEGTTYSITAATDFSIDEDNLNDAETVEVKHLDRIDVGVSALNSPMSESGLSDAESVTITIQNFGSMTQMSIPVFYSLDGGTAVQETYSGSIASGESDTYTFTVTTDLSDLADYEIIAGTELADDAVETNDEITETVSNFICQPVSDCSGFGDGVTSLTLGDQDIVTECDGTSTGYSDNSDIVFNFILEENPFEGSLQVGFPGSEYAIFIDFNDNDEFEENEIISSGLVPNAGTDFDFSINFNSVSTTATGIHRMRVRGADDGGDGTVFDSCGDLEFGRTNDYTANFNGILSIQDESIAEADFSIVEISPNIFDIDFVTSFNDLAGLRVYNMLGQEIVYFNIPKEGDRFSYNLDMSYVSAGVYIVQIGALDGSSIRTRKIVVK